MSLGLAEAVGAAVAHLVAAAALRSAAGATQRRREDSCALAWVPSTLHHLHPHNNHTHIRRLAPGQPPARGCSGRSLPLCRRRYGAPARRRRWRQPPHGGTERGSAGRDSCSAGTWRRRTICRAGGAGFWRLAARCRAAGSAAGAAGGDATRRCAERQRQHRREASCPSSNCQTARSLCLRSHRRGGSVAAGVPPPAAPCCDGARRLAGRGWLAGGGASAAAAAAGQRPSALGGRTHCAAAGASCCGRCAACCVAAAWAGPALVSAGTGVPSVQVRGMGLQQPGCSRWCGDGWLQRCNDAQWVRGGTPACKTLNQLAEGLASTPAPFPLPACRAFFLHVLGALPAALALPLALRFPAHPRLLLAVGALARCLLHPRPQPGMAALWVVSECLGPVGTTENGATQLAVPSTFVRRRHSQPRVCAPVAPLRRRACCRSPRRSCLPACPGWRWGLALRWRWRVPLGSCGWAAAAATPTFCTA